MMSQKQYSRMSSNATRTVFCRDCGSEIDERAEICPECGIRQKQPEYQQPAHSQKDPGIAAVASFFVPGLGQVYNGQIAKGIILGIVTIALAITGIGLLIAIPMWIWLVYDAYKTAEQTNASALQSRAQQVSTNGGIQQSPTPEDITRHQKVHSVLKWYKKAGPDGGLTKGTIRRLKKVTSFSELSENDRQRIVNAIHAHENEFGVDQELAAVRAELEGSDS